MIDVVLYDDKKHLFWDDFVKTANNGTLFHERHFLNYHPKERFKDHSLIFMEKSKPIALFPAVDHTEEGIRYLYSHRGSSFGGIVQPVAQSVEKNVKIVKALHAYAKREGFQRIMMTLPPEQLLKN